MKPAKNPYRLPDPEGLEIILAKPPGMGFIFMNALVKGMFRPRNLADPESVPGARILLQGQIPSRERIHRYRTICGFPSQADLPEQNIEQSIPAPFLQTLFVGLLGRYITSNFFPLTPLGLIHTHQSMKQLRPVFPGEVLDLSCRLHGMIQTEKGIKTSFLLEVNSGEDLVWKGISEFLTRSGKKEEKKNRKEKIPLEPQIEIPVPGDMGRKYASVSGDYNPHHLYGITAKLFGFRSPIAHGMWSLARVFSELEKAFPLGDAFGLEIAFKRPVFLPARTSLGWEDRTGTPGDTASNDLPLKTGENPDTRIIFELRDADSGIPHLEGSLIQTAGSGPR